MNKELSIIPDSKELVRQSTDIASLCREIVVASAVVIQERKYVRVEGWQAIATAHGCVASARDVRKVEGGMVATGEIRRMQDGALLATAEGFVGEDEPTWYGGEIEKDEWTGAKGQRKKTGKKIITELPKRPEYAIRAMAQTRAISRACRGCFAHVVVLMDAGLSTVPAEEVPEGGFNDNGHEVPAEPPPQTTVTITDDEAYNQNILKFRAMLAKDKPPEGMDAAQMEHEWCKAISSKLGGDVRPALEAFTLAELRGKVWDHRAWALSEVHRIAKEATK